MKIIRLVVFGILFAFIGLCFADEDFGKDDKEMSESRGLAVGKSAPAFTLIDQTGARISLEGLLAKGPVAVVFHRSVDWCLFCKLQMIQLERIKKDIEATGAQVVAISYDSPEKLKSYAKKQKITFSMLSDASSKTIDAYDMRFKDASPEMSGFARHGTFVIDQKGIIRSKIIRLSYKEKPAIDSLINALKDARKPTTGDTKS
jgi:peroxiredoxin